MTGTSGAVDDEAAPARRRARHRVAGAPAGRRWPVLVMVAAVVAGAAVWQATRPVAPPASLGTATPGEAGTSGAAQSSSWYCTGASTASAGLAVPTLLLTNTSDRAVQGQVASVDDAGGQATAAVTAPPRAEVSVTPPSPGAGATWEAVRVDLSGGGVVVDQAVSGPTGWAEAPCTRVTAATWYFASGATTAGHDLYLSLYNPTATDAVVDLLFQTTSGPEEPAPFEGLVVPAGRVVVAGVASYVQGEALVATSVVARTGRVVADLLETLTGAPGGTSLRLGSPRPERGWSVPASVNLNGGSVALDVFNPTAAPQRVAAQFALASGSPAPLVTQLPAGGSWSVPLSSTSRLPANDSYSVTVTASGGGVVVDRVVTAPAAGPAPQWGGAPAVPMSLWSGGTWVVPGPGGSGGPVVADAAPYALTLDDPGRRAVAVRLAYAAGGTVHPLPGGVLRVAPGQFAVVGSSVLAPAGTEPVLVTASGPLAVLEELVPSASPGVVSLPGVPLG